uniref:Uncharacterized protein n=1 Tax=Strongyloides venezuelensis TaxID=75913 RepID=A0A0K0F3K9_STRVS
MVRLSISLFLLANLINYSYSTKDLITDTVNSKLDEVLLEIKDDVNREIVKEIFNTIKSIDFPLELGDHDMHIKDKPFIEERIRENFKVIRMLSSQINNNLIPFLSQVFRPIRIPKGTQNDDLSQVLKPTRIPEGTINDEHDIEVLCKVTTIWTYEPIYNVNKIRDEFNKDYEILKTRLEKQRLKDMSFKDFCAEMEKIRNERIERERKEKEEKRAQDEKYRESYGDAKYFI